MIRTATLTLFAMSLIGCGSNNIETAKAALVQSIPIKSEITFGEVTNYPGGVVCGAFSGYVSYHDAGLENAPFIYRNNQIDRNPSPKDWKVFCNENPANALAGITGVGPITGESSQWLQVIEDFAALAAVLEAYYSDNNAYPDTRMGLAALVQKPESNRPMPNYRQGGYITQVPVDPWGNPYEYNATQWGRTKGTYELISLGRNGVPGGEGLDADLSSSYQKYLSHIAEIL